VGGRLFEAFDGGPADVFEVGRVLVWEPGARLVLEWRLINFAPGERTESRCCSSRDGGTRVTVEHRGWSAIREDHPARHGLDGPAFIAMIGLWWGELMVSMRGHAGSK